MGNWGYIYYRGTNKVFHILCLCSGIMSILSSDRRLMVMWQQYKRILAAFGFHLIQVLGLCVHVRWISHCLHLYWTCFIVWLVVYTTKIRMNECIVIMCWSCTISSPVSSLWIDPRRVTDSHVWLLSNEACMWAQEYQHWPISCCYI